MPLMGVREYARYRGTSHVSVLNAIKAGKLSGSLTRDPKNKPIINSELADREWPKSSKEVFKDKAVKDSDLRGVREEDKPLAGSMASARVVRETYMARMAKLDYEERTKKLIDVDEVKKEWMKIASLFKTKVLGIPSKARQRLSSISDKDYYILEQIVSETLEDISNDDN